MLVLRCVREDRWRPIRQRPSQSTWHRLLSVSLWRTVSVLLSLFLAPSVLLVTGLQYLYFIDKNQKKVKRDLLSGRRGHCSMKGMETFCESAKFKCFVSFQVLKYFIIPFSFDTIVLTPPRIFVFYDVCGLWSLLEIVVIVKREIVENANTEESTHAFHL